MDEWRLAGWWRAAAAAAGSRGERHDRALKTTSAVATQPARNPAPMKAALIGGPIAGA
jgi:hypothetical protein